MRCIDQFIYENINKTLLKVLVVWGSFSRMSDPGPRHANLQNLELLKMRMGSSEIFKIKMNVVVIQLGERVAHDFNQVFWNTSARGLGDSFDLEGVSGVLN